MEVGRGAMWSDLLWRYIDEIVVDACGVVLLRMHMAARSLSWRHVERFVVETYGGGWPWMHVEWFVVEACGEICCGDIWSRFAVDACGVVCCRCIWRRFVVETCGVYLCGDGLQRHVEVCRGGMWRLAEEACGLEVSRGGIWMRFCHAGVSRRSVEVICRGWRHVHEVFSRRRVKEVSRGDL